MLESSTMRDKVSLPGTVSILSLDTASPLFTLSTVEEEENEEVMGA